MFGKTNCFIHSFIKSIFLGNGKRTKKGKEKGTKGHESEFFDCKKGRSRMDICRDFGTSPSSMMNLKFAENSRKIENPTNK